MNLTDSFSSDMVAQAEAFVDYFSEGNDHELIPFTYGDKSGSSLNFPFSIFLELKEAIGRLVFLPLGKTGYVLHCLRIFVTIL